MSKKQINLLTEAEIEDIYACMAFAAELMNHQYSIKAIA